MLATRSWTGYELTQQVRRSLRFVWPTSEGHLYREQKRLVTLGWATVTAEPAGKRTRQRYSITAAGRRALRAWLDSEPEEPHFQVEGILRSFYADSAGPEQLSASMCTTAASAQEMLNELAGYASEYLAAGGPLEMLEGAVRRGKFRGRPMHPERLHSVALALDITTQLLQTVTEFFTKSAEEVVEWPDTTDQSLTPATRRRLERVQARGATR
jgi:DNA-binding PadR family transcriptional regulator